MASHRQVAANRRNAKLSTGPKSALGKARSRRNALKHGLTAGHVVLPGEDPGQFEALFEAMVFDLAPEGALEYQQVERAASLLLRLRRVPFFEAALFDYVRYSKNRWPNDIDRDAEDEASADHLKRGEAFKAMLNGDLTGKLSRYESALQRQFSATLKELRQLQAHRTEVSTGIEEVEAA